MFTREELNQKTGEALNKILRDNGLPWYQVENKESQIMRILNNQVEEKPLIKKRGRKSKC